MIQDNGIYTGTVFHERNQPFSHRLRYPVFAFWCDLAMLDDLHKKLRFFSHNKWNATSLYDRDHGARDGSPIAPWIKECVAAKAPNLVIDRVCILAFPRLFGYVFNPITVYFCFDASRDLQAIVYEVKNTFGEQHAYVALAEAQQGKVTAHGCDKIFHVSPFLPMDCRYEFRVHVPDDRLFIAIHQFTGQEKILTATWNGTWNPLSDRSILATLLRQPIMSFLVIAGIHWEALQLWIKGAKYFRKPQKPEQDFS